MTQTDLTRPPTGQAAPVYDADAERALLGLLMLDGNAVANVAEKLAVADFYRPQHATIYGAILDAHSAGRPTGAAPIAGALSDAGELERVGAGPYLYECLAAAPTATPGWCVERISELATRRKLEAAGLQITRAATTPGRDSADVAALAEQLLAQAAPRRADDHMTPIGALVNPMLDDIETRHTAPASIGTGFRDLDRLIGGLRKKQLITIAAPTGCGKSIFLGDLARHLAIRLKLPVALFSMEMSKEEIFERVLAAESGVRHAAIRDGNLDADDWQKVCGAIGPLSNAPFYMCDDATITVQKIKTRCQILARRTGLAAVLVDYVQLVEPSRRVSSEQEAITDVTRALKQLAGDLDLPVIAAAQLNREPDKRNEKAPQLADLRGSGSIANNSNVVMFVHRPDYYDPDSPRRGEADLVVRKARSGGQGVVTVVSQLDKCRFVEMARV